MKSKSDNRRRGMLLVKLDGRTGIMKCRIEGDIDGEASYGGPFFPIIYSIVC